MSRMKLVSVKLAMLSLCCSLTYEAQSYQRPAPPPSRYTYTLQVDAAALPKGVKIRESEDAAPKRLFISNASDKALVIDERFQNKLLVSGTKLVDGKVYHYFPNGVPMEGKTHLKGWQAPFGDIPETILRLPTDPVKIAEGRAEGLGRDLPAAEKFSLPATLDCKSHPITGEIHYHLNEAYDAFYKR